MPEGVRQVVERRPARLSIETRRLLRQAAGFSDGFAFRALQTLAGMAERTLLDCLDEALAAQLITTATGQGERYDFVHAIVRHALYDDLSPGRRVRLHRQIAEALKRAYVDREAEHAAELAGQYHASRGLTGAERGLPHALLAADQAAARYALAGAVRFLRMARDLVAERAPAERAEILCRLARAEAEIQLEEDALRTVAEALAALERIAVDAATRAGFLAQVAGPLAEGAGKDSVVRLLVERGLALLGDRHDLTWARLTLLHRWWEQFEPLAGSVIRASRWRGLDLEALAIVHASGAEEDLALTYNYYTWRTPEETEAAVAAVEGWHRPAAILRGLNVATNGMLYRHGDVRRAADLCRELCSAAERFGSLPTQVNALSWLSRAQVALGEFRAAEQSAARALALLDRLGHGHSMLVLFPLVVGLNAYLLDGDWPATAATARRFATDPPVGTLAFGLLAVALTALAYARAVNVGQAGRFLAGLTPLLESIPPTTYLLNGAVGLAGSAVWELQLSGYAARYRALALGLIAEGVGDYPLCSNELTVARMASLAGDLDEAQTFFTRARSTLDER